MKNTITKSDFDKKPSRAGHPPRWLSLEEIKDWADENNITTQLQWYRFFKENKEKTPNNIPRDLSTVFKSSFKGWGVFFGKGNVSNQDRVFGSYEQALAWAQQSCIKSSEEWFTFRREHPNVMPKYIPSNPSKFYKDFTKMGGWTSFLNTSSKTNGVSSIETTIKDIFCRFFNDSLDYKSSIKAGKKTLYVDMICHQSKIIVEYDGGYFHKDRVENDIRKNKLILKYHPSFVIVRLRGTGLEKIGPHDILVNERASHLQQVKSVFSHLSVLIKSGVITCPRPEKIDLVQQYKSKDLPVRENNGWASFEEFRNFLKRERIQSLSQYQDLRSRHPEMFPASIPSNPNQVYTKQWTQYGGWYGVTGRDVPDYIKKRKFMGES